MKNKETVDFLGQFSAIAACATPSQMDLLLRELTTKQLKVVKRFLAAQAAMDRHIPGSKGACDRSDGRDDSNHA